jgi:Protein of unknown function (DUF1559)
MRRRVVFISTVVVGGLAAGLFVVGISEIRQDADRTKCRHNLKMLGFGLINFHEVNGSFPTAAVRNPDLAPERRLSWLFEIDPFVHARMDPTWSQHQHEAWDSEGNLRLQRGRMPWYECPRRTEKSREDGLGFASYVGATGLGVDAGMLPKSDERAGVFGYGRQTAQREITDGTGVTIMAIETDFETGPWVAGGRPTARGLDNGTQPYLGRHRPFGGMHRDGVMAVMADGSVHFIHESISPQILEALFTIARGDDHDSPWND